MVDHTTYRARDQVPGAVSRSARLHRSCSMWSNRRPRSSSVAWSTAWQRKRALFRSRVHGGSFHHMRPAMARSAAVAAIGSSTGGWAFRAMTGRRARG